MTPLLENENIEIIEIMNGQSMDNQENGTLSSELSKLFAVQAKLKERSKQDIQYSRPILTQNDKPIIFPRSINIIQGKMGSHKSRMAEHIVSALLTTNSELTILGFRKTSQNDITVVYVDTERNLTEQLPLAIQTMGMNAGFSRREDVPNFEYTSLLDVPRGQRFSLLKSYLEEIRRRHSNHIFVVIDVLTDCINNFNDVGESMEFIDLMNQAINEYDTTFLGVIHENPSPKDNKARGHIGTEIVNKATTVMSVYLAKESLDLFEVKFIKCRSTERYPSYYIKYSKLTKQLEIANATESQSATLLKAPYKAVIEFLIKSLISTTIERKKLIAMLGIEFGCSGRTAIERIDNIYSSELLHEHGYELICEDVKDNKKNRNQYRLEKLMREPKMFA